MPVVQPDIVHCARCGAALPSPGAACVVCPTQFQTDSNSDATVGLTTQQAPHGVSATQRSSRALARGDLLGRGRYRVERLLERGGFGEVYLAHDLQLDARPCIVKRLSLQPTWDAKARATAAASFASEAALLIRLNLPPRSPQIPEIYEHLRSQRCLVMQYIQGESLGQLVRRRGRLPEREALRYVHDVCAALAYMHRAPGQPVLHRDVKPDNIIVDAERRVWLIDFGIAQAAAASLTGTAALTAPGLGTTGYTPPEQWRGHAEPRSDVYALAATLYALLTAELPPPMPLGSLRESNPTVRREVEELVLRAASPEPAARPTAEDFLAALRQLLSQLGTPPPTRPPDTSGFVGRAVEIARHDDARRRGPVVLSGMAGVGKTQLAAVMARRVPPGRVFWHTCRAGEGLEPLVRSLAAFLAWDGQPALWEQLDEARRAGEPPPVLDTMLDHLSALLAGQGYLLCLDDLHLVANEPLTPVLIERLGELVRSDALDVIITTRTALPFDMGLDAWALRGLDRDACRILLQQRGVTLDSAVVETVVDATDGHPALLLLAAEALRRATHPDVAAARIAAQGNVERYLLREVDSGLADDERTVMGALAALQGFGATRAAIEYMLGRSVRRTLVALEDRHLVVVSEGGIEREYGVHAILGNFYYDDLVADVRARLHTRAGEFYEHVAPDPFRAIRQYAAAGDTIRLAAVATAQVAWLTANGHAATLAHMLDNLQSEGLDSALALAVSVTRGDVATFLGNTEGARAHYTQALTLLDHHPGGTPTYEQRARVSRGLAAALEYEAPDEALAWVDRGLAALGGHESTEEALLLHRRGSILIAQSEYEAAQIALERSLVLLPDEAQAQRADVLVNLGVVACARGNVPHGIDRYRAALAIYERTQHAWRQVNVRQNLGVEMQIAGDWDGATREYEAALEIAGRIGNALALTDLHLCLGILQTWRGELEAAQTNLQRSLERARTHHFHEQQVDGLASLADLLLRAGDIDSAATQLADALSLADAIGAKAQLPEIHRSRAEVHLARGEPALALRCARESVKLAKATEDPRAQGMSMHVLGKVLHRLGRQTAAQRAFASSLRLLRHTDPYETARARVSYAAFFAELGEEAQAAEQRRAARAIFVQLNARHDLQMFDALLQG